MARQPVRNVTNQFTKGLITEFTGVNFPEDACTETYNCVFSKNGRVTRRGGLDYEDSYTLNPITKTDEAHVEYLWKGAGGDADTNFIVLQIGDTLYFYTASSDNPSDNEHATSYDLNDSLVSGSSEDVGSQPCQFTAADGILYFTHPYCEPSYIEYDPSGNSFSDDTITLVIRDTEGRPQLLELNERPTTITDNHKYNLYNAGWYKEVVIAGTSSKQVMYTRWDTTESNFPSISDRWQVGVTTDANSRKWAPSYVTDNMPPAAGRAPYGAYLLEAFNIDRSTVSGVGSFTVESSDPYRPSTCAFYAGRLWYSGVNFEEWSNIIYFSQTIGLDKTRVAKCYQENDPTDVDYSDLLATDGGTIKIENAGNIIKLWPVGTSLLVFATNGVWRISGSEGVGFTATDYSVVKMSGIDNIDTLSFVSLDGVPLWWNTKGIYTLQTQGEQMQVVSLTEATIKEFYETIPQQSIKYAKGTYNPRENIIQWLYRSEATETLEDRYEYDSVLNFNVETRAFYPWRIGTTGNPLAVGIIAVQGAGDNLGSWVTKVVTLIPDTPPDYNVTFSEFHDVTNFVDWYTDDDTGENFDSYFIAGYVYDGQLMNKFQIDYILVYSDSDEDNSCYVKGLWDWSNSGASGRETTAQQIYNHENNHDVIVRKLKFRGKGRTLQFKFYSRDGAPFSIIGWGRSGSTDTQV